VAKLIVVNVVSHVNVGNPVNAGSAKPAMFRRTLARAYHTTRGLYDRFLHPRRHLAVLRRLSNAKPVRRILVVCHGNICRSPYLESVLQRDLPDTVITSAGFTGSDRRVPEISIAVSARRGLDLSRHRSRPITQSKINDADLVIVMDAAQALQVARMFRVKRERIVIAGDLDSTFETGRDIRDPWKQSVEVFESSFDRLDRCAAVLVGVLHATK
jgi:protein-tyrosine phosphatase